MRSFLYLADGHHVDEAGNLISCTYVDFRDPAERFPITTLRKASSKRYAIPGCETIRISKPICFRGRGEGLDEADAPADPGAPRAVAGGSETAGETHCGRNGWIYCAFLEPETPEEQAAWREAMPSRYDAVSPIRRPREFARALGVMSADQIRPRGRTVLLKNAVEGRVFCTAHRSQTVYHGPVVYEDDPRGRLERTSSDHELLLLLVFLKHTRHRAQREYRFLIWADEEPSEARLDLDVSPALLEAMRTGRPKPEGSGFVSAGVEESSTLQESRGPVSSRLRLHVEALPAYPGGNRAIAPVTSWSGCRATRPSRQWPLRRSGRCEPRSTGRTLRAD